jgi:type 1 glutamine amidotransferase
VLEDADLVVLGLRFRDLPDEQMKRLVTYIESGRPIVALRTSTHAFNLSSPTYAKYHWQSKAPGYEGGFGKQVLGETWVAHHGAHGSEATRGIIAQGQEQHPILRGIQDGDIFGPTDVYTVNLPLPGDSQPLVLGQVVAGMKFDDPPASSERAKKNDPMMPVAWTKTYKGSSGKTARIFTTTMGASQDFLYEGTRRMVINACYWALGMEDKIAATSNVKLVGKYAPTRFSFGDYQKGVKPADHELK